MKKRNLLLLPLFALLIAGCKPTPSSSEEPSTSAPVTSQPPVTTSEPPVTTSEPVVTSEEPSVTSEEDEESLPSTPVSEVPSATVATIAELRAMTDGSSATPAQKEVKYQVTGTVTSVERNANISGVGPGWNFTIQSGDSAIMLYGIPEADFVTNWDDVKVGDLLTATGHLAPYAGLHELGRVEYVSHVAGTPIVPEVLTDISQSALVGKDSKLVTIEGLKLHGVRSLYARMNGTRSEISVNLDLRKGDVAIGTYMHYNIPMTQAEAVVALLQTATSNSTISWTGILTIGGGAFQMTNARVEEWTIVVGDPVVLSGLAFADTTKELNKDDVYSPKLVVTPFDGPLTGLVYASSNEAVATVDQTGKVTALAAGTTDITATVGAIEAKVVVTVLGVTLAKQAEFNFENFDSTSWGYSATSITQGSQTWATKEGRVDFDASDSASATAENGAKVLRFRGANVAYLESPEFTSVGTVTFDAKYYSSSHTTAVMTVSYQLNGESTWTLAQTISLTASYVKQEVVIDKENVKVRIDATVKSSNIDNLVIFEKPAVEEPVGPAEHFASLPVGHTSIADIVAAPVVGTSYTTRGVILGTNGGAFYMQDPLSGASLGGFGLTNEQKPLLKPGTVIDVTGSYAVNNNGGQLATLTALSVVAEENLSKVTPVVASTAAEFAAMKAETDLKAHARLVKLVGVKVTAVEDGGTNRFTISLDGETAVIAVNFMDSMNAIGKNRPEIKALALELLASQALVDIYAIQQATAAAGTWSFSLGTIDYIVVPVA